jgi:XRE family transcriptional regulator, aerobic/anaerobic benzoate catabolism transcriptional regulator
MGGILHNMMAAAPRARRATGAPQSHEAASASAIVLAKADPEFLASLGRRVREVRQQRGMARKVLAQSADVSERYLAALEGGEGNASVVLLRRVAVALGVRLTDLLDAGESDVEQRQLRRFLESLPPQRAQEALQRLMQEFGQDDAVRRKRITLIGLRGAGKSTLGGALAKELRRPLVELDREVEREAGMELSEVFLLYGQPGFRRIERRCLERIIKSQEDIVLTVGGGIVSEPDTYNLLLLNCFTVWIKAAPEEHMARVVAQGDMRPMAGHEEAMEDLRNILSSRESLYAKADAVVDTSGSAVEESFEALRQVVQAG